MKRCGVMSPDGRWCRSRRAMDGNRLGRLAVFFSAWGAGGGGA